jgi:DNA-binding MarR family transcriptional regulator
VDSGQLHRLGRRLIELSRAATTDSGDQPMTPVQVAIIDDVIKNPGTGVTAIGHRIGFVQSHVSASVARLRERGVLETAPDTSDGRRTRVQVTQSAMPAIVRRAQRPINNTITTAVGDAETARRVTAMLDELAEFLLMRRTRTDTSTGRHALTACESVHDQ